MSQDDTQEPVAANEETVEFSNDNLFDEPTEAKVEDAEPVTEPAAEEKAEEPAEPEAEKPEGEETPEGDAPTEDKPDEPVEEKSDSELKGMTREERKEYFQNLQKQTKQEIEQAVDQVYKPQDVAELQEEYMQRGYTEGEALILARGDVAEQKAQIAEATTEITELNANIRVDAVEARAKYEWMNPESTNFERDTTEIAAQLFELGTVKDERTGQIVDTRMTPMQVASLIDKIRNSGSAKAQVAAQKAAERQMAAAAPPTSTAPPAANQSADDKQASALERALNSAM